MSVRRGPEQVTNVYGPRQTAVNKQYMPHMGDAPSADYFRLGKSSRTFTLLAGVRFSVISWLG